MTGQNSDQYESCQTLEDWSVEFDSHAEAEVHLIAQMKIAEQEHEGQFNRSMQEERNVILKVFRYA
jgi:hypothetical protein